MADEIVKYVRKDGTVDARWENGKTLLNAQNLNSVATNLQILLNWYNGLTWQKSTYKPTYTAAEVGAEIIGTAKNAVAMHNSSSNAHEGTLAKKIHKHRLSDIRDFPVWGSKGNQILVHKEGDRGLTFNTLSSVAFTGNFNDLVDAPLFPTKISDLENNVGYITSDDLTKTLSGQYIGGSIKRSPESTSFFTGFRPSYVRISYTYQNIEKIYIIDSRFLYRIDNGRQLIVSDVEYQLLDFGFTLSDRSPGGGYNELNRPGAIYKYIAMGKGVAELPYTTSDDAGKCMVVNQAGDWKLSYLNGMLPEVNQSNVGCFLRAVETQTGEYGVKWESLVIADNNFY